MLRRGLGLAISLVMVFAVGCAKQPATMSSAPAPTGGTTTTPSVRDTEAVRPASEPASTTSPTPARPSIDGYVDVADLEDIHFDFDKYEIRPRDAKILDANAAWLKKNADQLLLIEGHCDERGTNEYNLALGERRARATLNYLVAHGVATSRITLVSYGEERPACSEHTEACWAKNRRAHFLVKRG